MRRCEGEFTCLFYRGCCLAEWKYGTHRCGQPYVLMILLANFIYTYNPYKLHVFIVKDTGFVVKCYFKVKDCLPF